MHKKQYLISLFILLGAMPVLAQGVRIENWKEESSLFAVRAAALKGNDIYAVTSGGMFRYALTNAAFTEYRTINALLSLDLSAIGIHPRTGQIWVGAADGAVDIYDPQNDTWKHLTDIRSETKLAKKKINAFLFTDSATYVAGDFGLLVYDNNNAPGDYVEKLGAFSPGTGITSLQKVGDTLWVTTLSGAAKAWINAPSLRDPQIWTNYTLSGQGGLPDNALLGSAQAQGELYVLARIGISQYRNGRFTLLETRNNLNLNAISAWQNKVYYSDNMQVYTLQDNQPVPATYQERGITGHQIMADGSIAAYAAAGGIQWVQNGAATRIIPNSPVSNLFLSLSVDDQGNVWTTADDARPQGFSTYVDNLWKNYSTSTNPDFNFNRFFKSRAMSDGSVWVGNWGGGIVKASRQGDTAYSFTNFDSKNSALFGVGSDGSFVVTGKPGEDRAGRVWIPCLGVENVGPVVVSYDKKGEFKAYQNALSVTRRSYTICEVDLSNTKWLGSYNGEGLLYFNERNTPDNLNDDIWGSLTTGNSNLPSNDIRALALDKNGALWIGTPGGLCVIFTPGTALQSGRTPNVIKVSTLSGQVVYDIAIDAVNNKWVATATGVWVLNEDGSQVLGTISTKNAPLPTDIINAIAIDNKSGKVYIGTVSGLLQGQTQFVQPAADYSGIRCYPQPFDPQKHREMVIEGLAEGSAVNIVTPSGMPVRTLSTKSGRIIWDGRTDSGETVSQGVYLILAKSSTSDAAGVIKCAVQRQ
jgi:ligand-binding sensor domain-containing protein